MRRLTTSLAIASTLLWAGVAAAQDEEEEGDDEGMGEEEGEGEAEEVPPPDGGGGGDTEPATMVGGAKGVESYPISYVDRPTTLYKGMIEIQGEIDVSISKELVGTPILIHPDVYYGVSDDLTVGLTHARGFCLNGEKDLGGATLDFCGDKVYNDIGIDGLFKVHRKGKLDLAAHGGLDVASFDPFTLSLRAGVSGEYLAMPKLGIFFDPYISIGITEREGDATAGTPGNKEVINVPVWAAYQITPQIAAWGRTGIAGPLDGFGDSFINPFAVGGLYALSSAMDAGLEIDFPNLYGKAHTADFRVIHLFFNYRM